MFRYIKIQSHRFFGGPNIYGPGSGLFATVSFDERKVRLFHEGVDAEELQQLLARGLIDAGVERKRIIVAAGYDNALEHMFEGLSDGDLAIVATGGEEGWKKIEKRSFITDEIS